MFITPLPYIWLQNSCIYWIPPAMCTLYNNIKIIRIDVQIMFLSIASNSLTNFLLHGTRNRMFARIHMRYVCFFQAVCESRPSSFLNVVRFANIETPNLARWLLQDPKQVQNLLILHAIIEVLRRTKTVNMR